MRTRMWRGGESARISAQARRWRLEVVEALVLIQGMPCLYFRTFERSEQLGKVMRWYPSPIRCTRAA